MPVIKSAIKRVKTNEKAEKENIVQKSAMRNAIKKFEKAQATGSDNLEETFKAAISKIDHVKSKGLIKANKASRDKSRLTRLFNK
ncbi:30S ribosomal protein S20 [Nicoliella spurrieriana]|uniref:Small ribosomal subunit protein bS20 n=1 Tax=Nicoliella spurrieriana TaxID=2925830 RepID=A0A976RRK8_9LACO|nr:30S ribosomal protein S20 [Nicoliella spurrieriana]UQS86471.1 30S ribosomal protein S20 [Nicoliella spurrieriana]